MCLAVLTKILILILNVLDQKKKIEQIYTKQLPMSQNRKEKIDSHRTDQRYHPKRKGLGPGLLFFSRWRPCCVLNVKIGGLRKLWPPRMNGRKTISWNKIKDIH